MGDPEELGPKPPPVVSAVVSESPTRGEPGPILTVK